MTHFSPINKENYTPEFTRLEEDPIEIPHLSDEEFVTKIVAIVQAGKGNYDKMDQDVLALQKGHLVSTWDVVKKLVQKVKETNPKSDLPMIYGHLFKNLQCADNRYFSQIPDFLSFDEDFRIACAKIEVTQNPEMVCRYIQDYGITDQNVLVDIAKLVASCNTRVKGETKGSISEYIDRFGIESEDARFEIAQIAVKNEHEFSKHIRNYRIEKEESRNYLARSAIMYGDLSVSQYLENFSLSSQSVRIDLGDQLLDNYLDFLKTSSPVQAIEMIQAFCRHLDKYRISRQDVLGSWAKRIAPEHLHTLCRYIQNFPIENEQVRIEIAKQIARKEGTFFAEKIHLFGITSQKALVEIAVIALSQSRTDVIPHLRNFNLDPFSKAAVFAWTHLHTKAIKLNKDAFFTKEAAALYPELEILIGTRCDFSQFLFPLLEGGGEEIPMEWIVAYAESTKPALKEQRRMLALRCAVLAYAHSSPTLLSKMTSLLDKQAPLKDSQVTWLAQIIMTCRAGRVSTEAFEERMTGLEAILNLRDPPLRILLAKDFIEELLHPSLDALLQGKQVDATKKTEQTFYFSALAISSFCSSIEPYKEIVLSKKKNVPASVKPVAFGDRMSELLGHKYFKNHEKMKSFLKNVYTLKNAPTLSDADKMRILRNVVFSKDEKARGLEQQAKLLDDSMQALAHLIDLGKAKRLTSVQDRDQLQQVFVQEIKNLYVSALNIDTHDFYDKYSKTLTLWRKPTALLTYAATLKKEGDEDNKNKLLSLLKTFTESVLNQNFPQVRYSQDRGSEHLLEIQKRDPKLLEEWKKGRLFPNEQYKVIDTDNPNDLLLCGTDTGTCQSVDREVHFSKCLVAYLLDPKIRLMAIKNKDGVIVARCMIRLLFDENTGKFVLFKEKNYPDTVNYKEQEILDRACRQRAEELGIGLVSRRPGGGTTLKAFKSDIPFEYVDSADDEPVATGEGYEIHGCDYSYKP